MNDDIIYDFDMSKLTLKDYLVCVDISLDPTSKESYRAFLSLMERTCVDFDVIPLSEMSEVQRQFTLKLDAYFANLMTVEGFMNTLASMPDKEEPDDGRQE